MTLNQIRSEIVRKKKKIVSAYTAARHVSAAGKM